MPLNDVIISAWISDIQPTVNHSSSRKRALHPELRLRPRKRQALVDVAGNMDMEPERLSNSPTRRRSPRKRGSASKENIACRRQAHEEIAFRETLSSGDERGSAARRDTTLDQSTYPILPPSLSSQYTVAISADTAPLDKPSWDAASTGQRSKTSGRRPPKSYKDRG